jgi:EmrB/QacA subfamily drug resistance transporter
MHLTEPTPYRHKWWIMVAVSLTLFLGTVDSTIVNVALPTLVRDFNTNFPTIQWVVLAFLLGLSTLQLSVGRLADMVGKKRIFAIGLVVFITGSVLCGLSPTVYWLIGFRLLQSIGAAMTVALGVAIVTETWPPHERGKAIGISGGVISLGIVVGPTLGGLIIDALNWRWIFFVNLPIGLVALLVVLHYIPPLKPKAHAETFDFLGAAVTGVSLVAMALALTAGQRLGFTDPRMLALFGLAGVCAILFLWIEQRVAYPMVDLSLFHNLEFSLNLLTGSFTFIAISSVVFLLPFYLELVLGLPVRQVGLLIAIVPIVLGIVGPLAGSLSDRFGTRRVSLVGLVFLLIGYLAGSRFGTETTQLAYVLGMLPIGLGMATFQSPNNSAIMGAAPRNRLGIASGMLSMTRTLGQTVGIALLGALFATRLSYYAGYPADISDAAPSVLVLALRDQFLVVAILIALGLTLSLLAWRHERNKAPTRRAQASEAPVTNPSSPESRS